MSKEFTHLDPSGNPKMVNVGDKAVTERLARARSVVVLDDEIMDRLENDDIHTKKGPVFQTAIIAGIMGAKKTHELIPLCHPLGLEKCDIEIHVNEDREVVIDCTTRVTGKTGVEMEALTAVQVCLLTVYDMCKAIDRGMVISDVGLLSKSGGKSGDWCSEVEPLIKA
jgi:cyclic pyranopterin phosphate synthase